MGNWQTGKLAMHGTECTRPWYHDVFAIFPFRNLLRYPLSICVQYLFGSRARYSASGIPHDREAESRKPYGLPVLILVKASLPVKSGEVGYIPVNTHLASPGILLIIPLNLNRQVSNDHILQRHYNQAPPSLIPSWHIFCKMTNYREAISFQHKKIQQKAKEKMKTKTKKQEKK